MQRHDFYEGRTDSSLEQFWKLEQLMERSDRDLDKMRQEVWGLEPEEWPSDSEQEPSEEEEDSDEPDDAPDAPELSDESDSEISFELVRPFKPGDDKVYYR